MKRFIAILLALSCSLFVFSQAPQGLNYQAVIRNDAGEIISNNIVGLRFTLRQSTASGISVYQETHSVTTTEFGLVNLVIGQGTVNSGVFSAVNWSANNYFLQVEVNTGGGFVDTGTQQMMSVPYALSAKLANDVPGVWKLGGNSIVDGNYIGTSNSMPLKFKAGGLTRMTLENSTGHIGMGTENPEMPFDILHSGSQGMRLKSSSSFTTLVLDGNSSGNIYFKEDDDIRWMIISAFNNSDDFVILNPHDDPQIGWTRPFCLQYQTMNVGIKTATPEASLHIQEGVDASLTSNGWLLIGNVDGLNTIYDNNEIIARDNGGTAPLHLNGNGGNVAIGQTAAPSWQLTVNGSAAKPGGGSWTATSDARLKDNVQLYHQGLEEVMKIQPVTYHYIENTGHDTKVEHVGVIAQDIQKIAPEMVAETEMEMVDGTKDQYLSVDPSAFTYMLINSIQEQQKMIEAQQKQIDALKMEIQAIKSK